MPEGPSILIAKEEMAPFIGKKVVAVEGNSKTEIHRIENRVLIDIKSWGKHLLLCFDDFTVRIHFLLFGSYLVNDHKTNPLRLSLIFADGTINFYSASIKFLEGDVNTHYDWSVDVMNDDWDEEKALMKLSKIPNQLICDALLEQDIFAGVGNIIKNEVLYIERVHPESLVGKIPEKQWKNIVKKARSYSFDFLKWKKEFTLRQHWLAHRKNVCQRCNIPFHKMKTGKKNRRSYFCTSCQTLYV